jgi:hypothetical protein
LKPTKPSAGIIGQYADIVRAQVDAAAGLEDKMEIIMQQKYIHFNILEPFELFAEIRRTRRPKLEPVTSTDPNSGRTLVNATMMVERFRLPQSEETTNSVQYEKVRSQDKLDEPIFWVPAAKRTESWFMTTAIKPPLPTP